MKRRSLLIAAIVCFIIAILSITGIIFEVKSCYAEHVFPVHDENADVEYFTSGGNLHLVNNGDEGVLYFSCVVVKGCGPMGTKSIPQGCEFARPFSGSMSPDYFYSELAKWNAYYLAPGEKTTIWVRDCYKNVYFTLQGFPAEDMSNREWEIFQNNMERVNGYWGLRPKKYFR